MSTLSVFSRCGPSDLIRQGGDGGGLTFILKLTNFLSKFELNLEYPKSLKQKIIRIKSNLKLKRKTVRRMVNGASGRRHVI